MIKNNMDYNDLKISFIIPVYNSQDYLKKCIDSIISQDYNNIEIVLVDDGSMDKSGSICDKYVDKFSFIKVFHKKNEGVAVARNIGIKESSGDYIFFIDNDDWLEVNSLKNLINIIKNTKADLIINRYYIFKGGKKSVGNFFIDNKCLNKKNNNEVLDYFRKKRINIMAPWEYVVKRSIILENNIFFNSSQNGIDDSVFSPILFCYCSSFYVNNSPIYYWRQSEASQGRNHKKDDFIKKVFSTFNSFSNFIEKIENDSKKKYIYFCMYKNIFSLSQFFKYYTKEEKNKIKIFLDKNKRAIKKSARYSGFIHFILFFLVGPFYGILLSYKMARIKGFIYKIISKFK